MAHLKYNKNIQTHMVIVFNGSSYEMLNGRLSINKYINDDKILENSNKLCNDVFKINSIVYYIVDSYDKIEDRMNRLN